MSVEGKAKGVHEAGLDERKSQGHGEQRCCVAACRHIPRFVFRVVRFQCQCALWCPFRTLGPQTGNLQLFYSWQFVLWQTLLPTAVMSWFRSGVQRKWTVMPWLPSCQRA